MLRKMLAAALMLVPAAAHADWYEASSDHFVVYADDKPDRVKAFTERLERFDKALKVLRAVPEVKRGPSARVNVFVLDSVSDIQNLYGAGGANVAGFYEARATGSVAFVPRWSGSSGTDLGAQRILLHEYGHHFMFNDWPAGIYPKWFVEGFAEFNSTAIFKDDGSITFGAKPLDRAYCVGMADQMPLTIMLKPDPGKMTDMQTCALYARGWLLTHYLTFDPKRRKQLGDYIAAINSGKDWKEASQVFGSLYNLDFELTAYAKRQTVQTLTIGADQLKIGEVKLRKLGPGEAAVMPAVIRSTRGVGEKNAGQVAALAHRLADPFPNDAAAQNELAEASFDAKDYAGAQAAADRALAVDPKSVHALIYKGMILQAQAEQAKSSDAAQWQAVRRFYSAANKADPEDPEPLILYYRSFKAAKQQPSANAQAGLLYAYALAPYDLALRLEAGRVFLQQGKGEEARLAMLPVAYDDEAGALGELARGALAALDSGGPAAALADLDKRVADAEAKAKDKKGA